MAELTDLEICKRIAEIEGLNPFVVGVTCFTGKAYGKSKINAIFSPLTDDALCFRLMVKHKASIFYEYGYAAIVCEDKGEFVGSADLYKEPNKAICLAIIEAHK